MKKSQIISMDFMITFAAYILALSVFFYALGSNLTGSNFTSMDTQAAFLLENLEQFVQKEYDFLDDSNINSEKLDKFISAYNYDTITIFKEFEKPSFFKKIDYCVYLENSEGNKVQIIKNFAIGNINAYSIQMAAYNGEAFLCGKFPDFIYENIEPSCTGLAGFESVVLSKPVIFNKKIVSLKILACAEKQ